MGMAWVVFIPAVSLLLVPTIYRTSRFRKVYKRALRCKAGPTRQTTTEESAAMWRPAVGRAGSYPLNLLSVWEHHYRLNATCFWSPFLAGWWKTLSSWSQCMDFPSSKKRFLVPTIRMIFITHAQLHCHRNILQCTEFLVFLLNQWVQQVNT